MKGIVHLFFVKGKVTRNMGKLTLKWHFDLYFDFWFIDSIIYFFDAFFNSSSDSFLSLCLCLISFINVWFIYLPKKTISQVKNIVCNPFGFGAVTQMTIKMMLSDEIDLLITVNFNFSFLKYSTNLVAFITVNYT